MKENSEINFPESVQNQFIHNRYWNLLYQTRLDHESFIIYSRILIDNIPVVSKYLLNNHNLLSPFCDQKKWFVKNTKKLESTMLKYSNLIKNINLLTHQIDMITTTSS